MRFLPISLGTGAAGMTSACSPNGSPAATPFVAVVALLRRNIRAGVLRPCRRDADTAGAQPPADWWHAFNDHRFPGPLACPPGHRTGASPLRLLLRAHRPAHAGDRRRPPGDRV